MDENIIAVIYNSIATSNLLCLYKFNCDHKIKYQFENYTIKYFKLTHFNSIHKNQDDAIQIS